MPSGFLQVAVSEAPRKLLQLQRLFEAGAPDTALRLTRTYSIVNSDSAIYRSSLPFLTWIFYHAYVVADIHRFSPDEQYDDVL